jgi:hypothetical protein
MAEPCESGIKKKPGTFKQIFHQQAAAKSAGFAVAGFPIGIFAT